MENNSSLLDSVKKISTSLEEVSNLTEEQKIKAETAKKYFDRVETLLTTGVWNKNL